MKAERAAAIQYAVVPLERKRLSRHTVVPDTALRSSGDAAEGEQPAGARRVGGKPVAAKSRRRGERGGGVSRRKGVRGEEWGGVVVGEAGDA
jgi:hypothetical protein